MNIGERIKQLRIQRNISVDFIANSLGVSKTTIYRYEDASIEKIPVSTFDKLCKILCVSPAELMGNQSISDEPNLLPSNFNNVEEAMLFLLQTPILAAYGKYDLSTMNDKTIKEFANEILAQFKLVSYKYQNRGDLK